MEKILLISRSGAVEKSFADLLDSPRCLARISSWPEVNRVLARQTPLAVFVGPDMLSPAQITEMVGLDSLLKNTGCDAYLLTEPGTSGFDQFPDMFPSLKAVLPVPKTPREWANLRPLVRAHLQPSAAGGGPQASPKEPAEIVVRLPDITSGSLSNLSLTRILYSLQAHGHTGILHLRSGRVQRRFGIVEGRFAEAAGADDLQALLSAFAWPDGDFAFQARSAVSGTPLALYPLLEKGLAFRPQRQLMDTLMPRMACYPTVTNLRTQRQDELSWRVLTKLLDSCTGSQSLENLFSAMGRDVTEAFRAAVVAGDTDLLIFRSQPTPQGCRVVYDQQTRTSTSRQPSPAEASKAERATGPDRLELRKELKKFHSTLQRMSPHEAFGVWKGCGREVVKETFYTLVKEHHPDVYGGNVSPEIRELSQKIFIAIRKAYADLLRLEGEQTVAPEDRPQAQQPGRKKLSTLRPGQVKVSSLGDQDSEPDESRARTPHRTKRISTPIEMGRAPTSQHPDLKSRGFGDRPLTSPGASTSRSRPKATPVTVASTTSPPKKSPTPQPSRRDRTASLSGARRRSSSGHGKRLRPPSSPGLEESSEDPQWRKEQMARLERKPTRRPTPIAGGVKVPPPADNAQAFFNTGYQDFKDKEYRKALESLRKAHEADPNHALYSTFYGYCLFQVDPSRASEARALLADAVKSGNRQALPDAHLFLGKILKVDNKPDRAYKHFQEALRLNPNSREAEREVRLHQKRTESNKGGLFKKLFKK